MPIILFLTMLLDLCGLVFNVKKSVKFELEKFEDDGLKGGKGSIEGSEQIRSCSFFEFLKLTFHIITHIKTF